MTAAASAAMVHTVRALIAAALAALLVAACGDTSKPAATTPPAATATAVDLAPLLVANDALPGFQRAGADVVQQDDADAWAKTNEEPDSSQLKALGFVAGAREDLVGPPGTYGLNLVERFGTPDEARERLSATVRDLANDKGRFQVSGVPGAVGFESGSGSQLGRSVAFSKGETVFLLSHQVSGKTPSVAQFKDAVRAWYAALPR